MESGGFSETGIGEPLTVLLYQIRAPPPDRDFPSALFDYEYYHQTTTIHHHPTANKHLATNCEQTFSDARVDGGEGTAVVKDDLYRLEDDAVCLGQV